MNAQNNETSPKDILPSSPNVGQVPSAPVGEHMGILDMIGHLFHKKSPESIPLKQTISPEKVSSEVIAPVVTPSVAPSVARTDTSISSSDTASIETSASVPLDKKTLNISDQIAGLFDVQHTDAIVSDPVSEMSKKIETPLAPSVSEVNVGAPAEPSIASPTNDERFARLLAEDSVYQSMIRSQDIKNIRLQLSMRYMLLMLAIFVVIAWVVNNRVIMFGFYDFPILSRIRDALFGVLTGLFCLTVWFGSSAWFHKRIPIVILRTLSVGVFVAVIVSIYTPFWR